MWVKPGDGELGDRQKFLSGTFLMFELVLVCDIVAMDSRGEAQRWLDHNILIPLVLGDPLIPHHHTSCTDDLIQGSVWRR